MLVKRNKKTSYLLLFLSFLIVFYYMLRVTTLVDANNGVWQFEHFSTALNELCKVNTPISFTSKNLVIAMGVSFFMLMVYETYRMQNKKNLQENTYGSAEWRNPKDIIKKRDKNFENNMILTETELISKNMKISGMNRHVILLGRPGTGKSRYYFKPNILNATGSLVVTDPKRRIIKRLWLFPKEKRIYNKGFEFG